MREVVQHAATITIVEPGQKRVSGMERGASVAPFVDRLSRHAKDSRHFAEGFRGSSHVIQCNTPPVAEPASGACFMLT